MAYKKQVAWPKPFGSGLLPIGKFGLEYTVVIADVPLYEYSREVWEISDTFPGIESGGTTILSTSTEYTPGSLKVYADGVEIDFKESSSLGDHRDFTVSTNDIVGKSLYCEYVPKKLEEFLGDQRDRVRAIYQCETGLRVTTKLREVIEYMRKYIDSMSAALEIESPIWVGGVGNQNIGSYNNILPGLTPTSVKAHLAPIADAVKEFAKVLEGNGYPGVITLPEPEYSVEFLSAVQEALTQVDEGLEVILS